MTLNRTDLKQEDLFQIFTQLLGDRDKLKTAMLNRVNVHGGLAVGGTNTNFALAAATHYMIGGVNYTKAATDNIATPQGNTSAGQFRKDLISINASGTVTVTAGTPAASQGAAVKPAVPAGGLELGWIEVPNSFTAGTTAVSGGMLKAVVHDVTFDLVLGS